MWEKIKEKGYGIATIAVVTVNLLFFILIDIYGSVTFYENIKWVLWLEIAICIGLIFWGIERLLKDFINGRSR